MRRPCSILVLCVLLGFSVSLAVSAEDVLETAYDESEGLPYEGTPLFSIVVPPLSARTTPAAPNSIDQKFGVQSRFSSAGVSDSEAKGATNTRISFALLCTLLC